jgi:tetratricopeptide (TPR) repeat protein
MIRCDSIRLSVRPVGEPVAPPKQSSELKARLAGVGALMLLVLELAWPATLPAQATSENAAVTNAAPLPLSASELDRQLSELEARLKKGWDDFSRPSEYRKQCADHQQHDRAIRFFQELVAGRPDHWRARLELSCAYIDKIPTCTGIGAFVNRGALAGKALEQQDIVVAKNPGLWVAYYCRGLNHLHWPRVLRHSDDAVKDLTKCVAIQENEGGQGGRPYYLRVHIALGDARTKQGEYKRARDAWQNGLKAFPDSTELEGRLQIEDDGELLKYVESERSLNAAVDTSLSFLDELKK